MPEYIKTTSSIRRTKRILLVLGAVTFLGGCASGRVYMSTLRDYPQCVTQAGISRAKVDACMDSSSDKADFNSCLAGKQVPQPKIDELNACVDSHRRSTIGNLF